VIIAALALVLPMFPQGRALLNRLPDTSSISSKIDGLKFQITQFFSQKSREVKKDLDDEPLVAEPAVLPEQTKCITSEGEVIYGEIPEDVVCKSIEKVDGALTVIPSRGITGH